MSTSGDIFKGIAKGFGREFIKAGGQVARGMKPTSKIDNKMPQIKSDIKRPERVTFSGVLEQVVKGSPMGSKVPEAGIRADRSGWKEPAPPKPEQQVDTSIFANKENYTREQLAEEMIKRLGTTGVDKDLRNRILKYYRILPKSTDTKKQKLKFVEDIIGAEKEHIIGRDIWKKKAPQFIYRRKKMEADVRKAKDKNDFLGQQKEKLQLDIYNSLIKGKKK